MQCNETACLMCHSSMQKSIKVRSCMQCNAVTHILFVNCLFSAQKNKLGILCNSMCLSLQHHIFSTLQCTEERVSSSMQQVHCLYVILHCTIIGPVRNALQQHIYNLQRNAKCSCYVISSIYNEVSCFMQCNETTHITCYSLNTS